MSFGAQVAVALYIIVSGAAGYERYQLQGRIGQSLIDVLVAIGGAIWLASLLDGRFVT